MKTIGFIGVGVMGKSMVHNLVKAGYEVGIYTRTKSKVLDLIEEGVEWYDDVKSCVRDRDIIMTMVGYPSDVEAVYFDDGIINHAKKGAILVDFTTSSPQLAKKIYEVSKQGELAALDAPVSGGDVGAKNATLSIMVGGDKEIFDQMKDVFNVLGKTINYTGSAGNGQHTKMANQIALGGAIAGVCEAMTYAKSNSLDVENMLACICSGAAGSWQMSNMAPRILNDDFNPGFYVKHYVKDLRIALQEASNVGLELEVLKQVLEMYQTLENDGDGDLGTQALIKYYK